MIDDEKCWNCRVLLGGERFPYNGAHLCFDCNEFNNIPYVPIHSHEENAMTDTTIDLHNLEKHIKNWDGFEGHDSFATNINNGVLRAFMSAARAYLSLQQPQGDTKEALAFPAVAPIQGQREDVLLILEAMDNWHQFHDSDNLWKTYHRMCAKYPKYRSGAALAQDKTPSWMGKQISELTDSERSDAYSFYSPLYTPVVTDDKRKELPDVIKFLLGEGQLDGCSFGEFPDNGEKYKRRYWWRKALREYALQSNNEGLLREARDALIYAKNFVPYAHPDDPLPKTNRMISRISNALGDKE
jgi:hypothetical protein